MKQLGMIDYFSDIWNIVDSSQFLVFSMLTILKVFDFVDLQQDFGEKSLMETYLLIISLFQAFAKGLSFVRIFDDYGFLVRMIGLTVNELIPFMAFFFVYTLLFAIAFMIMGIKLDHTRPGTLVATNPKGKISRRSSSPQYPGLDQTIGYMLYSFRNAIGDLTDPNYDRWIMRTDAGEISETGEILAVGLTWCMWLFQAIFMVIILLNYLIAVISQAYERVVNQRLIYSYIHRSEINLDYFQTMRQIYSSLKKIKVMVFVEQC